jgi:hypothetical protein
LKKLKNSLKTYSKNIQLNNDQYRLEINKIKIYSKIIRFNYNLFFYY